MDPVDGGHTETTVKRQTQKESSLAQSFRGKNKNKMRRKCSRCVRTCVSWVWLCVRMCVCVRARSYPSPSKCIRVSLHRGSHSLTVHRLEKHTHKDSSVTPRASCFRGRSIWTVMAPVASGGGEGGA